MLKSSETAMDLGDLETRIAELETRIRTLTPAGSAAEKSGPGAVTNHCTEHCLEATTNHCTEHCLEVAAALAVVEAVK